MTSGVLPHLIDNDSYYDIVEASIKTLFRWNER
jgi:hypothetical protein